MAQEARLLGIHVLSDKRIALAGIVMVGCKKIAINSYF